MASEFQLDLCFIRQGEEDHDFYAEVEQEMSAIFQGWAGWYVDRRTGDGVSIAVAEVNGLCGWTLEEEVIRHVEERMASECWSSLQGYRVQVIPQEDAGSCILKRVKEEQNCCHA
jgi:hypothetical protein